MAKNRKAEVVRAKDVTVESNQREKTVAPRTKAEASAQIDKLVQQHKRALHVLARL